MFADVKRMIRQDRKLQLILAIMLIVQIITAINQVGFFQPDQHFQIIEFSSYQLHRPSSVHFVWEFAAQMRPTIQVYLFSAYRLACEALGIHDSYLQLTIMRVLLSIVLFSFFTFMVFYYFRNSERKILLYVLMILNFSWALPYTRTLFSSEMLSSLFFFGAFLLYDRKEQQNFWYTLLIGFLFSISFYLRFQMGFALLGFGLWMIFFERKYSRFLPLAIGFLIGVGLNIYLDYAFYHNFVFTPFTYFHQNISEGKAATFGTASFLLYIGVLLLVVVFPPLSISLIYYSLKAFFRKISNPLFIIVIVFIVGHCLVSHKEQRFLFPIFNVLPILVGFGLPEFISYYKNTKGWKHNLLAVSLWFSIVVNIVMLILAMFFPFGIGIHFTKKLRDYFSNNEATVYYINRTPYELNHNLGMTFYQQTATNLQFKKIINKDSLAALDKGSYFTTNFNLVRNDRQWLDSVGYKAVLYSSGIAWKINEQLAAKKINSINDIWVLYRKEK